MVVVSGMWSIQLGGVQLRLLIPVNVTQEPCNPWLFLPSATLSFFLFSSLPSLVLPLTCSVFFSVTLSFSLLLSSLLPFTMYLSSLPHVFLVLYLTVIPCSAPSHFPSLSLYFSWHWTLLTLLPLFSHILPLPTMNGFSPSLLLLSFSLSFHVHLLLFFDAVIPEDMPPVSVCVCVFLREWGRDNLRHQTAPFSPHTRTHAHTLCSNPRATVPLTMQHGTNTETDRALVFISRKPATHPWDAGEEWREGKKEGVASKTGRRMGGKHDSSSVCLLSLKER